LLRHPQETVKVRNGEVILNGGLMAGGIKFKSSADPAKTDDDVTEIASNQFFFFLGGGVK
jgi:hypothetical protein